ncbi:MAG: hypothetical protein V4805_16845 [Pseudomonadota bacterium]
MSTYFKNKTLATFIAAVSGGLGLHRFYVCGKKDLFGWLHVSSLILCGLLWLANREMQGFFIIGPMILSVLASFIEALVIGLTPDDKWDARHNATGQRQSDSNWPLAVILVLTLGIGATALIASMARLFDLLFTGGAYG